MLSRQKESGFTLVEVLLGTILLGILAMSLSAFFSAGAESFSMVKSRNEAMERARYGMSRISKEIMYITTADIVNINSNNFGFYDAGNVETHYTLGTYQGNPAIMRNGSVLIPGGTSVTFNYYDENGNLTGSISELRRIQVSLVVQAEDSQGTVNIQTSIFPKEFLYSGFQ